MKKIFFILLTLSIAGIGVYTSCKKDKDYSSPPLVPPSSTNKPPIANAGPDIVIAQISCASLHWTELDGSGSFDPDDSIVYYEWTKISGPSPGIVSNNGDAKPIALDLREGLYAFELLVKDSRGLSSRDTMFVDATNWSLREYDLDITLNGTFRIYDNWEDCYDDPCSYKDLTVIKGTGSFAPIGQFTLSLNERADTATLSNDHGTNFQLSAAGEDSYQHIPYIRGQWSVFFKRVIQDGGGSFTGTIKVTEGTAGDCDPDLYKNLPPLTVTGYLDTTVHTVNLTIKGKIYF